MKVLTSIGFEACINAIYLVFNTLTYRPVKHILGSSLTCILL